VATPGVDFFRIDRSGSVRKLLIGAGLLIAIGVTLIGAHLVSRLGPELAHVVSLTGGLTVAVGLITGFGSMAMILMENVYLLLDQEGILLHENGKETKIAWGDLAGVSVAKEEPYVLIFERLKETRPQRWFAGKNAKDIHGKIEEAKRKADHGLLKFETGLKSESASQAKNPENTDESAKKS
jgi:hypothetical protein